MQLSKSNHVCYKISFQDESKYVDPIVQDKKQILLTSDNMIILQSNSLKFFNLLLRITIAI